MGVRLAADLHRRLDRKPADPSGATTIRPTRPRRVDVGRQRLSQPAGARRQRGAGDGAAAGVAAPEPALLAARAAPVRVPHGEVPFLRDGRHRHLDPRHLHRRPHRRRPVAAAAGRRRERPAARAAVLCVRCARRRREERARVLDARRRVRRADRCAGDELRQAAAAPPLRALRPAVDRAGQHQPTAVRHHHRMQRAHHARAGRRHPSTGERGGDGARAVRQALHADDGDVSERLVRLPRLHPHQHRPADR